MVMELPADPDFSELDVIGFHLHSGRHGKSKCDGHFCQTSHATITYSTENEGGIQSTADVVTAIQTHAADMDKTSNIRYYAINFDIDGPLASSVYMQPLLSEPPRDKELVCSQIKSFNHYIFRRDNQQDGLETERDIQMAPNMTLPALSNDKYSNVGKVMIETRHLLHEGTVINRWHGEKTKNVPPPTIAGNVEQEECKMTEVERQIKVREEMENEYCKNVDEIRNDMDQDESSNDDTDEIKHEDEMNVDTDVECVVSDTKVDIDWNKKTQKVLKKLCRDKGLKVSGNKSKLIERLKDPTNDKHKSNRKPMNE
eukprot:461360_1